MLGSQARSDCANGGSLTAAIHGLNAKGAAQSTLLAVLPWWVWILVGVALFLLLADFIARTVYEGRAAGRLVRVATALRERIRYTADRTHGSEVDISGGGVITGGWKTSEQRSLSERRPRYRRSSSNSGGWGEERKE